MGTRVAPSFANLFMADFEEKHVYTHQYQPYWWKRFIDDIFMIWTLGQEKLEIFIQDLNSCHPSIKFTYETSTSCLSFLDTNVKIDEEGTIYTDLYSKPTDTHNYLRYESCHPQSTKKGLPYSELLRVRRICTKEDDFQKQAQKIISYFLRQGYPFRLLQTTLQRVSDIDRNTLLYSNTKTDEPKVHRFFAVTTFHPEGNLLKNMISKNWDLLQRSSTTREIHDHPIVYGYRRNKNLRDLLVSAKLPQEKEHDQHKSGTTPCSNIRCRYCPLINTSGTIRSSSTDKTFYTKKNVSCKSHNLIYCITCNKCKMQYVGQTKRRLMDRFQGHLYNVKKGTEQIGRHFTKPPHEGAQDMTIHILSFIIQPSNGIAAKKARNKIELAWIHRLCTQAPFGLNILD